MAQLRLNKKIESHKRDVLYEELKRTFSAVQGIEFKETETTIFSRKKIPRKKVEAIVKEVERKKYVRLHFEKARFIPPPNVSSVLTRSTDYAILIVEDKQRGKVAEEMKKRGFKLKIAGKV